MSGGHAATAFSALTTATDATNALATRTATTTSAQALGLPAELLTAIFEELPTSADVAAAARGCRYWAGVGSAVLWRSPPESVLRQLPAAKRRVRCAAQVCELSLASRHIGRILATPLPRLTMLRVSLTAVRRNLERFCRFVVEHSGLDATTRRTVGGNGASSSTLGSTGRKRGGRVANNAAITPGARTRVLTKVCVTTSPTIRTQTLPTEAFVVLAQCLWLRHFEMAETGVTMAAV